MFLAVTLMNMEEQLRPCAVELMHRGHFVVSEGAQLDAHSPALGCAQMEENVQIKK